jgi:glycosyltransferase involved in cell wall biosynthesis
MSPQWAAMSWEPANLRTVVVLPTFNNERTLADVLSRVAAQGLPIIVVNDGCTDCTATLLEQWRAEHSQAQIQVQGHPRNRGKAAALQTGFAAALRDGFTHAITIDTDGQHDPEEIPSLLAEATRNPAAYVLGYRDDSRADYPARSRLGRRLSNFFIRLESGLRVRDSQCGMRIYPLALVQAVRCGAGHFGYEAEMITRAAWSGCPIAEVPIVTRYLPMGQRVSHFRPWLDTARGIAMHVRLIGRALTPWPHAKIDGRSHEGFDVGRV